MNLVHAVSFTLHHEQSLREALAHVRRLCPGCQASPCPVLLLCDLPDASCPKLPREDALIQALHTGIQSINAQQESICFLLVRRRVWDDASRQYLGAGQPLSFREVIAQLMLHGETSAAFELADIALASMKGRWNAVLFSDISVICTPDTPMRAAAYLEKHGLSAVGLHVLPRAEYPHSALEHISGHMPFSPSPLYAAQEYALAQQGQVSAGQPVLYTLHALSGVRMQLSVPAAPQCFFLLTRAPDWQSVFSGYRRLCRIAPLPNACVPPAQFASLAAAAFFGLPALVILALLPEFSALLHPRAWPGVLLRMALLPLTSLHALDVLLCRLMARSALVRLRVPIRLLSPLSCLFAAIALLAAAFASVYALVAVLPFAFLWLCMPVLYPVLDQTDDGASAPTPA